MMIATRTTIPFQAEIGEKRRATYRCKIADTFRERRDAFRLVHENYVRSGLAQPKPNGLRVLPHHLLDSTTIFIATNDHEVVRTSTLVIDGQLGLPLEATYSAEVQERRAQGVRLGEFCCLADSRQLFSGSFPTFVKLNRLMAQFARQAGVEEVLIEVHPRHVRTYVDFLAFERFGEQKSCSLVEDQPAVALSLNFAKLDENRSDYYDLFFAEQVPDEMLIDSPISLEEEQYFRKMVDFSLVG